MPMYKNVARRIAVQVRVTGGATPYVAATWANSSVAKMYYSQDGSAGTAISPSRIDATLGGWELSVGILTSTVWNCDELRIWWEGSGIDFGEVVFYPEADYSSTIAGRIDAAVSSRSSLDAAGVRTAVGLASANLDTQLSTIDDFLDTEITAIKAKTDNLPADPADASDIAASFSSLASTLSTIAGYIDTEVAAILAAVDTEVAAIKAKTDQLTFTVTNQVDANALTGSSGPSAATIADAVWDEALGDHLTAGTTGNALNASGSSGDPWATSLPGAYGAGSAGKILGDNLNATVGSRASQTSVDTLAGYVDTEVAAIKAKTDALPSDPADASDIAASFASIASTLSTLAGYVDTEVAAIKAKTDGLPSDPADASDIAAAFSSVTTLLNTLASYVDTEVAAIKAKTDLITAAPATATALADVKAIAQAAATSAAQIG